MRIRRRLARPKVCATMIEKHLFALGRKSGSTADNEPCFLPYVVCTFVCWCKVWISIFSHRGRLQREYPTRDVNQNANRKEEREREERKERKERKEREERETREYEKRV